MIITIIQDNIYLSWQVELLWWNCNNLNSALYIIIGYRGCPSSYAIALAKHCEAVLIEDTREDVSYPPTLQPHLLAKICGTGSGSVLVVDSDVLFRRIPNIQSAARNIVFGSDCGSYLSARYLDGCGEGILETLCKITKIPAEYVRDRHDAIGAQYQLPHLFDREFWQRVEIESLVIFNYLKTCTCSIHQIQFWTASMWAILYAMYRLEIAGEIKVTATQILEFAWITEPISKWNTVDVLHCAGATKDNADLFVKSNYVNKTPFGDDFSYVNQSSCSKIYVDAVNEYSKQRILSF